MITIVDIAHSSLAILMVICTALIFRRLNHITTSILQQALDNANERKATTLLVAEKLANEREVTAQILSRKVDEAATTVRLALESEILTVRGRLHVLEGANRKQEIEEMLDRYEEKAKEGKESKESKEGKTKE